MTVRVSVQGATFNMRGQLYRGHANASALSSSPVASALGSESDDPGSIPGRGKALCPWTFGKKKTRAPLFGLAKSRYYFTKAKGGKMGLGVGVNGHAHRYVLILPAKRVFLFFGVKASLGDDSS